MNPFNSLLLVIGEIALGLSVLVFVGAALAAFGEKLRSIDDKHGLADRFGDFLRSGPEQRAQPRWLRPFLRYSLTESDEEFDARLREFRLEHGLTPNSALHIVRVRFNDPEGAGK